MITQLRERTRADRFLNDVRTAQKKQRHYGRYIYLALVLATFLFLANLAFGQYLWLRAEGLILSDHVSIASPNDVQVKRVLVQPGEHVRKGTLIAEVQSQAVIEKTATLYAQAAQINTQISQIAIQLRVANALIKSAEQRAAETGNQLSKFDGRTDVAGVVSYAFMNSIASEHYAAMREKVSKEAERDAAFDQLKQLRASQKEAELAIDKLRLTYNGGRIVAPADGIVGPDIAFPGNVIRAGDDLMELYVGPKYVYAYLDTGTLYRTRVGDHVQIANGFDRTRGRIVDILPLSVPLPTEFQKAFHPPRRGQAAKIQLADDSPFPLLSTVSITGNRLFPRRDAVARSQLFRNVDWFLSAVWKGAGGLIRTVSENLPGRSAAAERVSPDKTDRVRVKAPHTPGTSDKPANGQKTVRAMWVWDTKSLLTDRSARRAFLSDAQALRLTDAYLFLRAVDYEKDAAVLNSLLGDMRRIGVRAWGMEGWRGYFSDVEGPSQLFAAADAMVRFNGDHPYSFRRFPYGSGAAGRTERGLQPAF